MKKLTKGVIASIFSIAATATAVKSEFEVMIASNDLFNSTANFGTKYNFEPEDVPRCITYIHKEDGNLLPEIISNQVACKEPE